MPGDPRNDPPKRRPIPGVSPCSRNLLALVLAGGCADDRHSVGQFFGSDSAAEASSSAAEAGISSSPTADGSAGTEVSGAPDDTLGDSSGYKFDTPSGMTAADDGPARGGCEKVD
ncbi:MAG: hypothetical protein ABI423_14155, partial [Burkholderiales bacterium]